MEWIRPTDERVGQSRRIRRTMVINVSSATGPGGVLCCVWTAGRLDDSLTESARWECSESREMGSYYSLFLQVVAPLGS